MVMRPFQDRLGLVLEALSCTGVLYMYKECRFDRAIGERGLLDEIECRFGHGES